MQLGETIATYDVDLALRGETGKFEVTSPTGEIYYVTCRPNRLTPKTEKPASQTYPRAFLIKKVAESVGLDEGRETGSTPLLQEIPTSATRAPFLLDSRADAGELSSEVDGAATPDAPANNAPEAWHLDLFYAESEANTDPPRAFVYVKNEETNCKGGSSQHLMTATCSTFNELDAEIRRLHAQLDEICLRAKKNFYKAYAATASA